MKYRAYPSHYRRSRLPFNSTIGVHLVHGMFWESEHQFGFNCKAVCECHWQTSSFTWSDATQVDESWLTASWLWCPGCAELALAIGIDVPTPWFVEDLKDTGAW